MAHHTHTHPAANASTFALAKDPVCGMTVEKQGAKHIAQYRAENFYFCSAKCHTKFEQSPEQYLNPAAPAQSHPDPEAEYTCPMHPEVRQIGPGSCPICGMALEPALVTADATKKIRSWQTCSAGSGSGLCWRFRSSYWKWARICSIYRC